VKNLIVMLLLFACGAAVGWLLRDNRDGRKQPDAYPVEISVHHFQHPDRTAEVMDVVSVEDASIVNRVGNPNIQGRRVRIDLTYPDHSLTLFAVER
jgi:hypothetical protein